MANPALVEISDLIKHFPASGRQMVRAVDGVSFTINRGETLGLVGESGCGKTTIGRTILRLIEPTGGRIRFDGRNLLELNRTEMRELRRRMQIIFQDPYSSLNPRMKVGDIIGEPLAVHKTGDRRERRDRVAELLTVVGLDPDYAGRYPHEFSGGQRQRIGIARALALNPDFIVADEPVSALDVSVQAQVVNLLQDLQEKLGLTYLFISHGLAVVKHISSRVGVMYLGKLVELAPAENIYAKPVHPYTQALLAAIPVPDPLAKKNDFQRLSGDVPTPINPPSGCRFHPRCPHAMERCRFEEPEFTEKSPGHFTACHL
ncbi:MAG: ATP-binding cassette domain-containing protein [Acidobacteria bacterium]|nr:ATP-binding cassette domain-containing protein [Acidobacteriota bacterium]MBK9705928.1 ATP-binding cassette domain-containing protein [Acidobacteriota bacterium]